MTPAQQREEALFGAALARPLAERAAFLDGACQGDPVLRARLESLLAAHDRTDNILADAAPASAATMKLEIADAADAGVDRKIGRYKLLEKIGEGGFGTVYIAEQEEPVCRRVALKIIKVGMDTRDIVARFEQERQALALMDHPNIARIIDGGATAAGRPYFVMELVRGQRITEYCDEQKLSTRQRLDLFAQVCHAIQHAHQKGIIHRDIKPSNILVTQQDGVPMPKVIDFGIAKATGQQLTDKTVFTQLDQFMGTPAYMSPEQVAMGGMDIDTRTDIYSLGVLLYQLLTGKTPFDTKELLQAGFDEMRRKIREDEPPRPSTRLSTLGAERDTVSANRHIESGKLTTLLRGDLDWIVMKALEKDRARRYETANGFAQDIKRFLADEPVSAAAPSAAYRFSKFARRNKSALNVAGAIAVILVAATIASTWQAIRATRERDLKDKARQAAQAAQKTAETALQDAEAISKFLTEVFQSPHPGFDGRTITVVDSLDQAAKHLETNLSTHPARRAKLQATLAWTYLGLNLHREAVSLREKVRDHHLATSGLDHPDTQKAMEELATSYALAGRQDEALKLREELLALLRKVNGPEHPTTFPAMHFLADSHYAAGRRDEAHKLWEEMLTLCRKVSIHPEARRAVGLLLSTYYSTGRREEALKLREEWVTIRRAVLGPEHPEAPDAMRTLAGLYFETGRRDEALKLREEELALRRKVKDPNTLTAMEELADSYADAGRRDEALKLREEALAFSRKVFGSEHWNTWYAMRELASSYDSYRDAGRRQEALKLREAVLSFYRKEYGPEKSETLNAMNALAISYANTDRRDEALKLREEVLTVCRKVRGSEDLPTLIAMHNLAISYVDAGRWDEALKLREELLLLRRKALGPEHADTIRTMETLADSYVDARKYAQAEPLRIELLAHARKSASTNASELLERLVDMADLRYRQQRYTDAETLYRERIQIRLRRPGGETSATVLHDRASLGRLYTDWAWAGRATNTAAHERAIQGEKLLRETIAVREQDGQYSAWRKAELQSRLGGSLSVVAFTEPGLTATTREQKLVEAEAVLQQAQAGMEQDKKTETKYLRDGIERFIRLYEAWPKPDPLAEWKQKLAAFDEAEEKRKKPAQP